MALIKCKECEKEYSDKAKECPQCGCPTINNTIETRRKEVPKCSVKIKGNEKFYPPIGFRMLMVGIGYIAIAIFLELYILEPAGARELGIIFLIVGIGLVGLTRWLAKKLPGYKRDLKHRKTMNEYFQNRFLILDNLPDNCSSTKNILTRSYEDNNDLMFKVYMEAYKYDADAIVINDSNVVMKDVKIGKSVNSSYNIRDMNATLVRY